MASALGSSFTPRKLSKSKVNANHSAGMNLVRGASRPLDEVEFERTLVAFFVNAADLLGIPRSVAAIYGICFASVEPLAFSEIRARLDVSAGSVSQGLRVLREVGALKVSDRRSTYSTRSSVFGHERKRRDLYEPDLELRKLISHFIEHRLDRQLDSGRGALQSIICKVPRDVEATRILSARLHALQVWHDRTRAVLPLIRAFLKLG